MAEMLAGTQTGSEHPENETWYEHDGFKPRMQDILLTLMFGALIYLAHDVWEKSFILGLAVLQLVEGRIPFLITLSGRDGRYHRWCCS